MDREELVAWLLQGDVSIQYQTRRDLQGADDPVLQQRIAREGWGERFLRRRRTDGHWGRAYYQPKWTSTHYTLLDLKNLGISSGTEVIRQTIRMVLENEKGGDGGINPSSTIRASDMCINGMVLNFASYFGADEGALASLVDLILAQVMPDGGFNCERTRGGAVHSSLHTTISVAEGIAEYAARGYTYRLAELRAAQASSHEFMLAHRLFRSDHTGAVIDGKMLMLSYPSRWHYDILRALDYFGAAGQPFDPRMEEALQILRRKRRRDGTWPLQARHPGELHFEMEQPGRPSRWNTLRALRVLMRYDSG
jgi:hypothetical protein